MFSVNSELSLSRPEAADVLATFYVAFANIRGLVSHGVGPGVGPHSPLELLSRPAGLHHAPLSLGPELYS